MKGRNNRIKVAGASGKREPTRATSDAKTQRVDWEVFLAGISRGKSVLEYGANRTIFVQGDPADSIFYLHHGEVRLAVTSKQGKEAIVAFLETTNSSAKAAWRPNRYVSLLQSPSAIALFPGSRNR